MGKQATARRLADTEAQVVANGIRTSPRKLNIVATAIRGLSAEHALAQLTFIHRRIAVQVKVALQSAIANAENNHQLDVDRLYVAEAYVGKGLVMRRWHARGRGRTGQITKSFSNLTIVVREREEQK
ncbi:MAG: 50S ribosomal protein L22 [Alphaproteobacteria bacterium]|nr:50S ribosomal protein L22 [Alphaproteobacteria bacterium]